MINSGSLKDISNTDLRIQLTNWISTLDDISKQEMDLGIQRENALDIFRRNDNSLRTIFNLTGVNQQIGLPKVNNTISNLKLLNSIEFENNTLMFVLTCYSTEKAHYEPLMEDLNNILELIDAELK